MRRRLIVALLLAPAAARAQSTPSAPLAVTTYNGVAYTQTQVALTAGTDAQLLPANALRRTLCIWVTGSSNITLGYGAAAQAGIGVPYGPTGLTAGRCWGLGDGVPSQSIHAISSAGTTVVVEEGN